MKYKYFLFSFFFINSAYAFNEDHLKSLQEQINLGTRIYAVGFDLQGANLKGWDLKDANFSNANLRRADLSDANLSRALLAHANISKANCRRAKLNGADLTDANVNGAKFKDARLLDIKYQRLRSAKGTLFEDKQELLKKIAYEQKIHTIEKSLLKGGILPIYIEESWSLKAIHTYLYEQLTRLHKNKRKQAIIVYSSLNSQNADKAFNISLKAEQITTLQQCSEFLQAPFFSASVAKVASSFDSQALIVFLRNKNIDLLEKKSQSKLDLHEKLPLRVKYQMIDDLIKKSYYRRTHATEIITGRGLHNPQGEMGILWNLCRKHLLSKKFKPYIQEIESINKQGGWKVILKDSAPRRKGCSKVELYPT